MGITIMGDKCGLGVFLTAKERAIRQWLSKPAPEPHICGCLGPRLINQEDENLPWIERQFAKTEPVCPCAMAWVEQVDGNYYKIKEHRSPSGITHTAELLGPAGGPYTCDRYGTPKCASCAKE